MTHSGVLVDLAVEGDAGGVPPGVQLAAYRIVQEALTNTLRHAHAHHATVHVRVRSEGLRVEVSDDGCARDGSSRNGGHGLIGMRERVAVYGGSLDAGPAPTGGFCVVASLPFGEGRDPMIRVAVVDDQALVRAGFAVLLRSADDMVVVGEAGDGQEALELVVRERPDIVLMDIRMPGVDGLEATRLITSDDRLGQTKVLILTTFDFDEYVFEALSRRRERLPAQGHAAR